MRTLPFLTLVLSLSTSVYSFATESVPQSAQSTSAAGPAFISFAQVFLALAVVLAAIFGTAWLARRFTPGQLGGVSQLRVVSGVMVGAKERVVIVELADTWLVLGVTSAQVSMLHSLPKPTDMEVGGAIPNSFAERLAVVLKARKGAKGKAEGDPVTPPERP
ncbi:flagellar biosynthetic protein FliO [Chitinimonas sp. BJB300]|uniref:flagellar biosynthetic protein FliO n=1 Tax=Chitinimonas sp. BJB300 TaxID=1559339 RepID=UPI000C0EF9AA|nr:flagellar biosynthetic protein FliO [Chitinimonas sp. BJB300]PHV13087.1 flagellar biosynthetic protein FliO [Chitinimonas sp. BJB300]TSJ84684.1 flagellar biosynthetic protein FliO [Chitinimonas sp. BJB300]